MPDTARVRALIALVESGQYVRAIEDFYHPNASMQENSAPPRTGRDALIAHEKKVLAGLTAMKTRRVDACLVNGNQAAINWVFEMTGPDGITRILDELALQTWDGDRIRRERFYYDPAQLRHT